MLLCKNECLRLFYTSKIIQTQSKEKMYNNIELEISSNVIELFHTLKETLFFKVITKLHTKDILIVSFYFDLCISLF